MAQMTEALAHAILAGDGITRNEVEQLCHFFLRHSAAPADVVKPDCNTCANRGRVDGLSQETHCEHCIWQESWRTDHYQPKQGKNNG